MKAALVIGFFEASAFAQNPPTVAPAACGPNDARFDMKLDENRHRWTQPEPGKARVYFIQDIGLDYIGKQPQTRFGIDGRWAGATLGNSYLSVSIEPGEHRVCANPQTGFRLGRALELVQLVHFTAEAGKTCYFRKRFITTQQEGYMFLDTLDSDEGEYSIRALPMSVSTMKK